MSKSTTTRTQLGNLVQRKGEATRPVDVQQRGESNRNLEMAVPVGLLVRRLAPTLLAEARPEDRQTRNLGTFDDREAAEKHERAVQYFKRKGG